MTRKMLLVIDMSFHQKLPLRHWASVAVTENVISKENNLTFIISY